MRIDRIALDKEDANKAREEEDFDTFYLTRGEGERRRLLMKRDVDIARRWRARHNLEARWWHGFT
jgi:hypothetical protein